MPRAAPDRIDALRRQLRRLEMPGAHEAVPFGLAAIDDALPWGGLARAGIHELVGPAGPVSALGAVLAGRCVRAAAQPDAQVLWCTRRRDLYCPGLARMGLVPARLIVAQAQDRRDLLWAMEEGLRCPHLAAVVGEVAALDLTAQRRLQLAAGAGTTLGLVLRCDAAADAPAPSAALSRWQIDARPSVVAPGGGVGRARWHLDLVRCRGGKGGRWTVEWDDATLRFAMAGTLADRPADRVLAGAGAAQGAA